TAVCRVVELILKGVSNRKESFRYDPAAHHKLAVQAARQAAVLLKNEGSLLPGNPKQKAAVIGAFAKTPRIQGAGSSKIHPIAVETPWDCMTEYGVDAVYAPGYPLKTSAPDKRELAAQEKRIAEACKAAEGKDIVYIFAGLPEGYESEGFDRGSLSLPQEQNRLIEAVCACNPNVAVILIGGAPVELPWIGKVRTVLLAYLGGEGMGRAIAELLLGLATPCGKLAETWPLQLKDTPGYHYFPGGRLTAEYRESIYIGYRYYEKAQKPVLFPFGHGLSYTEFSYSGLTTDRDSYAFGETVRLTFSITNCGNLPARETALIFTAHESDTVFLPKKELREFVKVTLGPGETKQVSVLLDTAAFGYYNTAIGGWHAESGRYRILVGRSSEDCPLEADIRLSSPEQPQPELKQKAPVYYRLPKGDLEIDLREFEALYGKKLPAHDGRASRPYDWYNTLEDVRHTLVGKIVLMYADRMNREVTRVEKDQSGMMSAAFKEMTFIALVASADGAVTERMMEGIVDLLNGHYLKGLRKIIGKS
ncbi:MAG: glycoside hydrolase family 3 C-terminal domain-containing protein, partial [Clostridia bacterium]|nr:glycoside hydrolase family 3 C-terminal domain-containing protein [Clostridia bacterium]